MDNFSRAFNLVVSAEGEYSNDPRDPGGETKYGISKASYPDLDIAALTLVQAKEIYKKDYWDAVKGDQFSWTVAYPLFDCAVNQGRGRAVKFAQIAAGVKDDGLIGPATVARLQAVNPVSWLNLFMAARATKYAETANFDRFGKGWMNRLFTVHSHALGKDDGSN